MEFRVRSKRVPLDIFPRGEVRIFVGHGDGVDEARAVLRKLERRGQWAILHGIASKRYTVEEVVRLVDEKGLDLLHLELRNPGLAPPIGETVDEWLATIENHGTRGTYAGDIRRLVEFVGEDTPVNEVGRHHINDLLASLREKGLAANTRQATKTAASAFYSWFDERDLSISETTGRAKVLKVHPVKGSDRVLTKTTRHRFLSREEFDRLMDVSAPRMQAQYATLAFAGLRLGEFTNLPPEHVRLPGIIRIRPHGDWVPKGFPRYDHGVRDVPVHREYLLPLLEEYQEEAAGERTFFVSPRTGQPWSHGAFRDQLERDCKAAGLVYGQRRGGTATPDGITPHTFRHTLGSWLAMRDVQLKKIALILGDTVTTVEKYYAHLLPSALDETLNEALRW